MDRYLVVCVCMCVYAFLLNIGEQNVCVCVCVCVCVMEKDNGRKVIRRELRKEKKRVYAWKAPLMQRDEKNHSANSEPCWKRKRVLKI